MEARPISLFAIASIFLRAGLIGFGGPTALIAILEKLICRDRGWLDADEFRRAVVLCKLLPGPTAYQVAVWVGKRLRGTAGAAVSAICFLLPAFVLVCLLASLWHRAAEHPWIRSGLEGLRIAAWFLLVEGTYLLTRGQLRWRQWIAFASGVACAFFLPRWEPVPIFGFGLLAFTFRGLACVSPVLLLTLFWVHAKAASTVFGTGLAVVPALEAEAMARRWMSLPQFLDGLTIAQATPGPITILSTYLGLEVAGFPGAIAATLGMYLPGFLAIGWILPALLKWAGEARLATFYRGAVPAVLGCLWGSAIKLFFLSAWPGKALALLAGAAVLQVGLRLPILLYFAAAALAAMALRL